MIRSNWKICAKLTISGEELQELQKYTGEMAEAFGLDGRIDRYQGKRPISFAGEDFDCLFSVIELALEDPKRYPDHSMPDYRALNNLYQRLEKIYKDIFPNRGC